MTKEKEGKSLVQLQARLSVCAQSCLTLSDPMDCTLPGSSIHGIFQAKVLEWGAIAFSKVISYGICLSLSN